MSDLIDRVTSLLKQNNITTNEAALSSITIGASGANIFSCNDQYIVKYVNSADGIRGYQREYDIYNVFASKIDFVPEVIFQTSDDFEMLIVLKKYAPVKKMMWDEAMQLRAADLCARINTFDHDALGVSLPSDDERESYDYDLSLSYENWGRLQNKFPNHIDAQLLKQMYGDYDDVVALSEILPIPKTFCHGDLHPGNFLLNGDSLLVCDWQEARIGKGIGDIAFFCNRGGAMRIGIDKAALVDGYRKSLVKHANIDVALDIFLRYMAASEFHVSFKFWAEHLLKSDLERVLKIYTTMVDNYNASRKNL